MIAPKFVRLMDSVSPRKPQLLLHPGSRNLHSYIKESMRLIGDRMDVDEGSMQHNQHEISEHSTLMLDASRRHISENMQVSTGLIHYYSAPSSVLASITNEDEELLAPLNKSEDSEFAQFLSDTLSSVATSSEDSDRTTLYINEISDAGDPLNNQQHSSGHLGYKRIVSPNTRFKRVAENNIVNSVDHVSLSAISEHGTELNSNSFCSSRMSILHTQQGTSNNHIGGSMNASSALVSSATTYSGTSQESTGLARNSSLPARLLSRLVLEEYGETGKIERPGSSLPNSYIQPPLECSPNRTYSKQDTLNSPVRGYGMTSTFTGTNGIAVEVPSKKIDKLDPSEAFISPSTGGLLRQSSSPAGLLSRLSLDGIMDVNRQFMMPSVSGSSSGECGLDRRGSDFIPNFGGGMWDDPISPQGNIMHGTATLATKKRVRQLETKMLTGSTLLDSDQMTVLERGASLPAHFSMESATSPESQLTVDRGSSDAVLCRARAKRGCATHPRSIAERVRRTKISERMKKLQELVPNMDKQTNTADMLDEAVEYVKFLQRQVQELSESQHKCDCSSQQKNS